MLNLCVTIARRLKDYGRLLVNIRGLEVRVSLPDFDARLVCLEETYSDVILGDLLAQQDDLVATTQLRRAAAQPIDGQLIALAIDGRRDNRIKWNVVVAHLDEGLIAQA